MTDAEQREADRATLTRAAELLRKVRFDETASWCVSVREEHYPPLPRTRPARVTLRGMTYSYEPGGLYSSVWCDKRDGYFYRAPEIVPTDVTPAELRAIADCIERRVEPVPEGEA